MRIAFTSCMSAHNFPDQPVWDEIAAANPDVLVLLGDAIYLDAGGPYAMADLKAMGAYDFAVHAHGRYLAQLAQPQFRALIQRSGLAVHAIWDDHDFLWDNACGADVGRNPVWRPLLSPTRALFAAFRDTLARHGAPGSFPATPPAWTDQTPAPGYTVVDLGHQVYLHLTDGRSFKSRVGRKALLGAAQTAAIEAQLQAAPAGATHLLASGVVVEAHYAESWLDCPDEHGWLLRMAQQHNLLVLSGDIHDNNLASYQIDGGRSLFEATASGAAVRTAVTLGSLQRNYGLLDIDADGVAISLYKSGARQYSGRIDRASWR